MSLLSEGRGADRPSRRVPLAVAGAALLALAAGVALYATRRGGSTPAPAPPAATARTGATRATAALRITADAEGAVVHVDDRRLGLAPQTARDLSPGRHRVRVEGFGRQPFEEQVELAAGEERDVHAVLPRTPGRAKVAAPEPAAAPALRVDADVAGASVFLDRQYLGTTPLEIPRLEPGAHRLNVAAEGYPTHAEEIEGGAQPREIAVQFKRVELDRRVAVRHKRTFGSRQGTLRADPTGLSFDSEKPEDSFHVGFDQLEVFAEDYLEDELKVKLRGGRSYSFTSRSGDPDELFVFHREVEQARQRRGGAGGA